jgi:hypothetical protein
MSYIVLPYTFVADTLAQAGQVNADFTAVTNIVNGSLDNTNIAGSAAIALSKLGLNPGSRAFNQTTTGQATWASGLTTDVQPQIQMTSNAGLQFGPGGTTVPDIELIRSATNTLRILVPGGGPGTFDGNAGTLQNFSNITLTSGGSLNLNGGTLVGFSFPMVNNGRLYLTSGSPYADTGASNTIYYGPTNGNQITLYNGTTEVTQTFSEVSLVISTLTASTMYDVYVKSASSTTVVLSTAAWGGLNTPPTRGVQDGRYTKNGDATSLLIASIYINASQLTTDNSTARQVSNVYNAVPRGLLCTDTTSSWTSATTSVATANGNTTDGVGRVSFAQALGAVSGMQIVCYGVCAAGGSGGQYAALGFGINSTTTYTASGIGNSTVTGDATITVSGVFTPTIGYNYLQRLDSAPVSGTVTFYGALSNIVQPNALTSQVNN